MDIKQRIETFNKGNAPWYIVEHDNGQYSLCLPLDLLSDEYYPYCQDAFDAYAAEIGEPAYSKNGLSTHGSGYEWEAAFREAFKDDPNIRRILFDCEAGGFFCYANDLALLEDFGSRFKDICEDTEGFVPIISEGIRAAEARRTEQEALMRTVRWQLMSEPSSVFEIMTPAGEIRLTPEDSRALLDGERQLVQICGETFPADFLLEQEISAAQTDLFHPDMIRVRTEEPRQDFLYDLSR